MNNVGVIVIWSQYIENNPGMFLRRHLDNMRHPDIPLEQHVLQKRLDLADEVLRKKRIYLDQKYWIYCRDALQKRPRIPQHRDILDRLTALVDSARVVCPVSFSILAETAKQGDRDQRHATALVIDMLSKNTIIQCPNERIRTEFCRLWDVQHDASKPTEPLNRLVWTFPSCILGELEIRREKLDPGFLQSLHEAPFDSEEFLLALEKSCRDYMAEKSFSELLDLFAADAPWKFQRFESLAVGFNAQRALDDAPGTDFDAVYNEEVAAFLNMGIPDAASWVGAEAKDVADFVEGIKREFRQGNWKTQVPYLDIFAGINALCRRRGECYEANDLFDHDNACAALPYCDALFTEKHLKTLLTQSPLKSDERYACRVLSSEDDVVQYLQELESDPPVS